ncbi:unnamed protein product [Meloidogyne enterolobii]|uniref:Uncharacterized protein n=1 Tax=Meloidogyne enterolobii TaxID=390850 RepID=A0ACB1BA69_MELEN
MGSRLRLAIWSKNCCLFAGCSGEEGVNGRFIGILLELEAELELEGMIVISRN